MGQGHTPGIRYASRNGEERGSNVLSILATETVNGTESLAWGATRVSVRPTGRNARVSKFEGLVTAFPIGTKDEDIVQVTGLPKS